MNEFQTYEFTTHQKTEGLWLAKKIALILLYIAYVLTVLIVGFLVRIIVPLLAFIPLTLWIIIFLTWRFVDVDYECSMTSGYLTFSKVYGSRSRKKIFEVQIKSIAHLAPYVSDASKRIERYAPDVIYSALSSSRANNPYFLMFEMQDGKKAIFLFEADDKCLKIFKFYNPALFVKGGSVGI